MHIMKDVLVHVKLHIWHLRDTGKTAYDRCSNFQGNMGRCHGNLQHKI